MGFNSLTALSRFSAMVYLALSGRYCADTSKPSRAFGFAPFEPASNIRLLETLPVLCQGKTCVCSNLSYLAGLAPLLGYSRALGL